MSIYYTSSPTQRIPRTTIITSRGSITHPTSFPVPITYGWPFYNPGSHFSSPVRPQTPIYSSPQIYSPIISLSPIRSYTTYPLSPQAPEGSYVAPGLKYIRTTRTVTDFNKPKETESKGEQKEEIEEDGERDTPVLTEEEATARAASIHSDIHYKIFMDFRKGKRYTGFVRIEFRIKNTDTIFLDYGGDKIDSIVLNGVEQIFKFEKARITLVKENLDLSGLNILNIKFRNRYFNDGNGIHTFTDVDDSQYLYTQSEPFWGNRVLPLFDQPDLKATYQLHATAPEDWKVITSVQENYTVPWNQFKNDEYGSDFYREIRALFGENIPNEHNYWQFGKTALLSTYLHNIVCGPYERIQLDEEKRYRGIPMSIYCRKTLVEYARNESHNIFEFNKKGIEFYERVFNLEYPFGKLDTIFCPEFTVGAMEYPGAVTYTEDFLPKNKNTTYLVSLRGVVILHELAHMWFGNAVTMRWWNGLWLNESFADFVCYLAWADIRPNLDFETYDAWLDFMVNKGWGYKEDQEKTTHSIAGDVKNTEDADNIFDGITYSKGAAALRQLTALVGNEKFSEAVSEYFQEFKFKNTELEDLLDAFQRHLGDRINEHGAYDISNWQKCWLETPGLNTVQVEWERGNGNLTLRQGVALKEHPTLRFHRIDLGFYNSDGEVVKVEEIILNDQETTTINVENFGENIVAILPNYNDLSFIKVILDQESLKFFEENLTRVTEPLAKGLLLRSFYDGVRDCRYKASKFITLCSELISNESSNQVVDLAYKYISSSIDICPMSQYTENAHKLYRATRTKIVNCEDSQFNLSLIKKLISYGFHEEDIEDLKSWYEGNNEDLQGHEISIDQKWTIVYKIHGSGRYSSEEKQRIFDELLQADGTETKRNYKLRIEALIADENKREELFNDYFSKDCKLSYVELEASCAGFTSWFLSEEVRSKYYQRFFDGILDQLKTRSRKVAEVIFIIFLIKNLNFLLEFFFDLILCFNHREFF